MAERRKPWIGLQTQGEKDAERIASLERELTELRETIRVKQEAEVQLVAERKRLKAERDAAREVVKALDPDKLDLLADWFDQDDANKGRAGTEVQTDLRRWAHLIRSHYDEVTDETTDP